MNLQEAAREGDLKLVIKLVEEGADIQGEKIHEYYDRPLTWACTRGHLEVVKYLVEKGANIHASNDYALRRAEKYGYHEVVAFLKRKMLKEKLLNL